MNPRGVAFLVVLAAAALGSWYLTRSSQPVHDDQPPHDPVHRGYYLKLARILGTGEDGNFLYEIEAEHAEQQDDDRIEFTEVRIRYTPGSAVTWTISADQATLREGSPQIALRGHVRAVSNADSPENDMEIRTQYLELDPERFVVETDERVQLRIGARSLTATGMLASLYDDKIELKANISGKFVP